MSNSTLKLFSVYHTPTPPPSCDHITPIQVGRSSDRPSQGQLSDDTGDHIAHKNSTYCELTALYWIWKHLDSIPETYVGLCHYRRYFIFPPKQRPLPRLKLFIRKFILGQTIKPQNYYIRPLEKRYVEWAYHPKLPKKASKLLRKADVILPCRHTVTSPEGLVINAKEQYQCMHVPGDWELLRSVIIKLHPESAHAFDTFFENSTSICWFNMFIASKEIFSDYCSWLFRIFDELEPLIPLKDDPYQRRVFGFMSERLLNFYVHYHGLVVAELPVIFFKAEGPTKN